MNKKILHIFLFVILFLAQNLQSAQLSSKDLEADLKYYYKTVQQQKLTPNDKMYILNKIYEKYKNTNLNLTKLEQEIEKVKKELEKEKQKSQKQIKVSSTTYNVENKTQNMQKLTIVDERKDKEEVKTEDERYKISSGDVLFVRISPAEELSREVVVTPDGRIVLPLIGTLKAEGFTIKELQDNIEKNLAVYIANPKVSITVKYFSKKQIFVMGEVKTPGGYQYKEGLKLFELISQAGGLTQYAGARNIKIYRGEKDKQEVINVNLEEIISDPSKDILLKPGDIIEVPKQPKTIAVIGAVNYPGNFDWYDGIDILKAISLARGHTDVASLSTVKIFREKNQKEKEVINVDVAKLLKGDLSKNVVLQPGDVVYIPRKFLVTGQWFVNTVLPWLTLITTILLLINYTK